MILLKADDCIKNENDLYLMCMDLNIFYKIDLKEKKITLIDSIPEESITAWRLCAKMVYWGDELFFIPFNVNKLWIFNMVLQTWRSIEIRKIGHVEQALFFQAVVFEDHLFLIGSNYPAIVDIDLHSEHINYVTKPYEDRKDNDILFRCSCVKEGKYLYLASCVSNEILVFNMQTCEHRWIALGNKKNRYAGITKKNNYFWIAPRHHTAVVRWDGADDVAEFELPKELCKEKQSFLGVAAYENRVIFPAMRHAASVVLSDEEPEKMSVSDRSYIFYKEMGDKYVCMDLDGNLCVEINSSMETIKCQIEKKELFSYLQSMESFEKSKRNLIENDILDLHFFAGYVVETKDNPLNLVSTNGKDIWNVCKQ